MRSILYRSAAAGRTSDVDLYYLLAHARDRNAAARITGALIHDRGFYFHWIEGDSEALAPLWARIRRDARHGQITLLMDRLGAGRRFAGSPMHFAHRDATHARVVNGFSAVASVDLDALHHHPQVALLRLPVLCGMPAPAALAERWEMAPFVLLPLAQAPAAQARPAHPVRHAQALRGDSIHAGGAFAGALERLRVELGVSRQAREVADARRVMPVPLSA